MFLTEHPTFLGPGIATSYKARMAPNSYHTEDKIMLPSKTEKVSFIIETKNGSLEHLCYWRLDQRVASPGGWREVQRLSNQVEGHINDLAVRTGCFYLIAFMGLPEYADEYIRVAGIEVQ